MEWVFANSIARAANSISISSGKTRGDTREIADGPLLGVVELFNIEEDSERVKAKSGKRN